MRELCLDFESMRALTNQLTFDQEGELIACQARTKLTFADHLLILRLKSDCLIKELEQLAEFIRVIYTEGQIEELFVGDFGDQDFERIISRGARDRWRLFVY